MVSGQLAGQWYGMNVELGQWSGERDEIMMRAEIAGMLAVWRFGGIGPLLAFDASVEVLRSIGRVSHATS